MKRIGFFMKTYYAVMLLVLAISSCVKDYDGDISTLNPQISFANPNFFLPLMDANDVASIYGVADDNDNISVIASGSAFEISGLPQTIFLAPFEYSSIVAININIGMLRDEIPYTHDVFTHIKGRFPESFYLTFPEHNMTYRVKHGNAVHTVCVTFGSETGVAQFRLVGTTYYWVYEFKMNIIKMTVDGVEQPVPEMHTIEYKLYFNRLKDSIG